MINVLGWRKRQIEQSEMCSNYGGFCKKEWVGLTDEEIQECLKGLPTQTLDVYARRIEQALKDKNI
jgi:hypothetical protein